MRSLPFITQRDPHALAYSCTHTLTHTPHPHKQIQNASTSSGKKASAFKKEANKQRTVAVRACVCAHVRVCACSNRFFATNHAPASPRSQSQPTHAQKQYKSEVDTGLKKVADLQKKVDAQSLVVKTAELKVKEI